MNFNKLIIWDADGTILADIDEINSVAIQIANILNIDPCNDYRHLRNMLNESEEGKKYFKGIIDFLCTAMIFRADRITIIHELINIIKFVDANHFIVSGGFSDLSRNVLSRLGYENLFTGIFGRELGRKGAILEKFTTKNAIFISDSLKDLKRAMSIHPDWIYIAVTWGMEKRKEFDNYTSILNYICDDTKQLMKILNEI